MTETGYVERDVHVRGLKLHYQEWGAANAPVILMVHGFGVSGHMFDEFAERMKGDYRLIALDQRGHGDSDWAEDGDYSRDAFVEDLEAFRAVLDLDAFILMGHSMGGLNSASYAVKYGQHVRGLVLVDVGPEAAKEGVENIARFTKGPDELEFEQFVEMAHQFNQRRSIENIRERMRHRLKPSESGKWTWKFDRRFREQNGGLRIGSTMSSDETWELFRKIAAPTLLVRGVESDVLTQDVAERTAREMQRARLAVVPSAGHSVPGDNPDEFTAAVKAFLSDLSRGAFAAAAGNEPPPLTKLVREHERRVQRGPSVTTMVIGGVTALVALVSVVVAMKQRSAAKEKASARGRARSAVKRIPSAPLPEMDLSRARKSAASLMEELSVVGQRNLSRVRELASEIDIDRARHAAAEAADALSDANPLHLDAKALRRQSGKVRKQGRSLSRTAVGGSLAAARMLTGGKKKKRSKLTPWR